MTLQEIRERLLSMQDQKYRDFQVKLIPSVPPETVIGVRTPDLRKLAKEDACKIEHDLSEESFAAICKQIK